MADTTQLHPKDWSVEDLIVHLEIEMNYPITKVLGMTQEEMIEAILKDEIDKE